MGFRRSCEPLARRRSADNRSLALQLAIPGHSRIGVVAAGGSARDRGRGAAP